MLGSYRCACAQLLICCQYAMHAYGMLICSAQHLIAHMRAMIQSFLQPIV